jgi:hypothetical protein
MRNADEIDEQWRDLPLVMPSYPGMTAAQPGPAAAGPGPSAPGPGGGRIRYAYGGLPPRSGQWTAAAPAMAPHADLWVLVCGGIAALAAFAAAFVASGGATAHAATPQTTTHTIVVQACPTAMPGR